MSTGNIVQVIGAVVDVEFPRANVPAVYDALTVADQGLTLEVQQQLGDGIVRAIAMGASDGLKRGMQVENTGAPISVPVGPGTLGRVMNVLGEPVDTLRKPAGARLLPVSVRDGVAYPLPKSASHMLSSLAAATHCAVLDDSSVRGSAHEVGARVPIIPVL